MTNPDTAYAYDRYATDVTMYGERAAISEATRPQHAVLRLDRNPDNHINNGARTDAVLVINVPLGVHGKPPAVLRYSDGGVTHTIGLFVQLTDITRADIPGMALRDARYACAGSHWADLLALLRLGRSEPTVRVAGAALVASWD
jgi:hypothetical protein